LAGDALQSGVTLCSPILRRGDRSKQRVAVGLELGRASGLVVVESGVVSQDRSCPGGIPAIPGAAVIPKTAENGREIGLIARRRGDVRIFFPVRLTFRGAAV